MNKRALARAARLSEATIRQALAGRSLLKQTVACLVEALSRQYGRTIAREEIDGLRVEDASPA